MSSLESNIVLLNFNNDTQRFEATIAESVDHDGTLYTSLVDTNWTTNRRGTEIVLLFPQADWDLFTDWTNSHSLTILKLNEESWRLESRDASTAAPRARSTCSETDRGETASFSRAADKLRANQSMFITGEGGCGKSHLAWQLYSFALTDMKWEPVHIAVTAFTGVAAQELAAKKPKEITLARDVTTLHSFMGVTPGVKTVNQLQEIVEKTPALRAQWAGTFLLIIDEISMVDATLFTMLYELRARFNSRMVVICLGDFCQLPPHCVTVRDSRTGDAVSMPDFCFMTPAWRTLIGRHVITLTTNYRVENDREWRKLLTRVRMGHQTDADRRFLLQMQSGPERPITEEHVHIYCRRRQVSEYNEVYFGQLISDGREVREYSLTWTAFERITNPSSRTPIVTKLPDSDAEIRAFTSQVVGDAPGMADNDVLPKKVRLCVNARVIFERNLLDSGLGNGMQGTVVSLADDFVEVLFDGRNEPVQVHFVEHTEISTDKLVNGQILRYKITCKLLPLQLAGAITVHKAQGMTLNKVYIKLYDEKLVGGRLQRMCTIDFPGQVYVALSRGRSSANTIVDSTFGLETNSDWLRVKPHQEVVVYYSSLSDVLPNSGAATSRRSIWGSMLDTRWLQRDILVTETPLFILYQREKEYNDRLEREAIARKRARK